MSERKTNLLILGLILLLGFALRVYHLLHVSPIADEYITMLATRAILRWGYPRLPSGLYYDHGLLFTYSSALFVGVEGEGVEGQEGDLEAYGSQENQG